LFELHRALLLNVLFLALYQQNARVTPTASRNTSPSASTELDVEAPSPSPADGSLTSLEVTDTPAQDDGAEKEEGVVAGPGKPNAAPTVFQVAGASIKRNILPGMVLQVVAITLVLCYYLDSATQAGFNRLAGRRLPPPPPLQSDTAACQLTPCSFAVCVCACAWIRSQSAVLICLLSSCLLRPNASCL
jgi:hypothetical protein